METGLTGLNEVDIEGAPEQNAIQSTLSQHVPYRILYVAQAFRHGLDLEDVRNASKFDPWFLEQIKALVDAENTVRENGLPDDAPSLLKLKKQGFSDARLAELTGSTAAVVAAKRRAVSVTPSFKRGIPAPPSFPVKQLTCIRPTLVTASTRRKPRSTRRRPKKS